MTATFTFNVASYVSVDIEFDAEEIEGMSEEEAFMYLKETYECEAESQAISESGMEMAGLDDICIDED